MGLQALAKRSGIGIGCAAGRHSGDMRARRLHQHSGLRLRRLAAGAREMGLRSQAGQPFPTAACRAALTCQRPNGVGNVVRAMSK